MVNLNGIFSLQNCETSTPIDFFLNTRMLRSFRDLQKCEKHEIGVILFKKKNENNTSDI